MGETPVESISYKEQTQSPPFRNYSSLVSGRTQPATDLSTTEGSSTGSSHRALRWGSGEGQILEHGKFKAFCDLNQKSAHRDAERGTGERPK